MKRKLLHSETPCPEPLRSALIRILAGHGIRREEVEFVKKIEHARVSSNYSNVISCGLSGGRVLRLFGKYTESSPGGGHGGSGYGHWGGVAYEAEVYRPVLRHATVTCPKFYGAYRDEETCQFGFFIEYLEGGWFVTSHSDPIESMGRASRWLGRFHAENERHVVDKSWPFLKRYDAEYYLGWARRTSEFAGDLHRRYPWLPALRAVRGGIRHPPGFAPHGDPRGVLPAQRLLPRGIGGVDLPAGLGVRRGRVRRDRPGRPDRGLVR